MFQLALLEKYYFNSAGFTAESNGLSYMIKYLHHEPMIITSFPPPCLFCPRKLDAWLHGTENPAVVTRLMQTNLFSSPGGISVYHTF